jgi:hypothetical protein
MIFFFFTKDLLLYIRLRKTIIGNHIKYILILKLN